MTTFADDPGPFQNAQRARLRRFCEQLGVTMEGFEQGWSAVDLTPIIGDDGKIVPDQEDFHVRARVDTSPGTGAGDRERTSPAPGSGPVTLEPYLDAEGTYAEDGSCFFCDEQDSTWAMFLRNDYPGRAVSRHTAICDRCRALVDSEDRSSLSAIAAGNEVCRYYRITGDEWVDIFYVKRSSEFANRWETYPTLTRTTSATDE
jgi:hypothetical protein